mgnify:CR=1 FL=1
MVWFCASLENQLVGKRDELVKEFAGKGIEVRPIVAGNFTRNKVIEYMDYKIPEPLINADDIHFNGFFIGNHSKTILRRLTILQCLTECY